MTDTFDLPTVLTDLIAALRDLRKLATQPELLAAAEAAELCGVSPATWWRLCSAGETPAPLKVGGSTRWARATLHKWIDLGCPSRKTFETLK